MRTRSVDSQYKPAVNFLLTDDPELYELLNQYRRSLGWTWKRFILIGIAETINSQQDNPDLVVRVADYISNRR